jgi:hypothetical protein
MGKKGKGHAAKGGKNSVMNGRALFQFNPDLFVDDEGGTAGPTTSKNEESKQADDDAP